MLQVLSRAKLTQAIQHCVRQEAGAELRYWSSNTKLIKQQQAAAGAAGHTPAGAQQGAKLNPCGGAGGYGTGHSTTHMHGHDVCRSLVRDISGASGPITV